MCRKTSAEGRVQSRYGENPMSCCDAVGPHKRRSEGQMHGLLVFARTGQQTENTVVVVC